MGCWWERCLAQDNKRREELGARQGRRQHCCQPLLGQVSSSKHMCAACDILMNAVACLSEIKHCGSDRFCLCVGSDFLMTVKALCSATTASCFDILAEVKSVSIVSSSLFVLYMKKIHLLIHVNNMHVTAFGTT